MKPTTASIADDLDFQISRPCCVNQGLTLVAMEAARDELRRLDARERKWRSVADALRRAIGDHNAPGDCYATGPLTGDAYLDLVQCPACAGIAAYDAALAPVAQPGTVAEGA